MMTEPNMFPTKGPEEENDSASGEMGHADLLAGYADEIDNYSHYSQIAQRIGNMQAVIASLNEIDTEVDAFYAQISEGTLYRPMPEDSWHELSGILVQGPLLPVIGDQLQIADDGKLVLVDTARGIAYADFKHLEKRAKDDAGVQEFSAIGSVAMLIHLGEAAKEQGVPGTVSRTRWGGQAQTDPSVE
jgi:hypothetical protein